MLIFIGLTIWQVPKNIFEWMIKPEIYFWWFWVMMWSLLLLLPLATIMISTLSFAELLLSAMQFIFIFLIKPQKRPYTIGDIICIFSQRNWDSELSNFPKDYHQYASESEVTLSFDRFPNPKISPLLKGGYQIWSTGFMEVLIGELEFLVHGLTIVEWCSSRNSQDFLEQFPTMRVIVK